MCYLAESKCSDRENMLWSFCAVVRRGLPEAKATVEVVPHFK